MFLVQNSDFATRPLDGRNGIVRLKNETIMDFIGLTDFNAVATHGSFSAASRATGVPKATLSRRVRGLETALGVRLLERGTRAVRLTEEGQALRGRTANLLDDLAEAGEEIAGRAGKPRGRLRLSVPGLFAHTVLGKIAARFAADYRDIVLDITVDDRYVDPVVEGVDIVIRVNPAAASELVGHCFLKVELVVAASPMVEKPLTSGMSVPAVVLTAAKQDAIWTAGAAGLRMDILPRIVMRCSSMLLVRDAVLAGAGAAIMPQWLAEPEFASGALVNWGMVPGQSVEVWALHASNRLKSAKVDAFMKALRSAYPDGCA